MLKGKLAYHPQSFGYDTPLGRLKTKDHIVPKAHNVPYPRFRFHTNVKVSCYYCNLLRARLQHCTGLLMIAIQESKRLGCTPLEAAKLLHLPLVNRHNNYLPFTPFPKDHPLRRRSKNDPTCCETQIKQNRSAEAIRD